jgi:hypothetical protein
MIQVKSREEAIEWAKRAPMGPNEIIEVRQVQEFEDFTPEIKEKVAPFEKMQQEIGQKK